MFCKLEFKPTYLLLFQTQLLHSQATLPIFRGCPPHCLRPCSGHLHHLLQRQVDLRQGRPLHSKLQSYVPQHLGDAREAGQPGQDTENGCHSGGVKERLVPAQCTNNAYLEAQKTSYSNWKFRRFC